MATKTVPGAKPDPAGATVTPIATKQREHATAILTLEGREEAAA